MSRIDGIGTAAASAYAGIRDANSRVAGAATTIAKASSADTVTISDAARAASGSQGDLVSALTDLRLAPKQTAASVAVLRTLDEVSEEILRTFSERK
jgi:hypothetical protein